MNKKNKQHFTSMNSIKETFSQQTLKSLLKIPFIEPKQSYAKKVRLSLYLGICRGKVFFNREPDTL